MRVINCITGAVLMGLPLGAWAATPLFHHDFNSARDVSGTYKCQAMSGARLTKIGDEGILDLGDADGWFDFGESFGQLVKNLSGDYTIAVNLRHSGPTATSS